MRYSGVLGISEDIEVKPGKWEERITEHPVVGEEKQRTEVLVHEGRIIPGTRTNTSISVFALGLGQMDDSKIRYVTYSGKRWTIGSIVNQYPKLTIYIGEEYHGPAPVAATGSS